MEVPQFIIQDKHCFISNDLATRKEVKVSLSSKAAFAELIKTMSKFRIYFMFCRIYSN